MHCGIEACLIFFGDTKLPLGPLMSNRVEKDPCDTRPTKMAAPVVNKVEMYFFSLCSTLLSMFVFNVNILCSYTLDYIAALNRSPMYASHGLAVCAI